jgi:gas vesicle protein
MKEQNSSSGTGIMTAALVGAAVGAGIALLFAPGSGKETRAWLAHRTRKFKNATMNAYAESKGVIQRAATEIGSDGDRAGVPYDRPVYGNKSDLPQKRS